MCIFYRDNIDVCVHDHVNRIYKPSLFINVNTKEKPLNIGLNIGLVYRSPNNEESENKKLINQLNFATKKLRNLIPPKKERSAFRVRTYFEYCDVYRNFVVTST